MEARLALETKHEDPLNANEQDNPPLLIFKRLREGSFLLINQISRQMFSFLRLYWFDFHFY